MIIIIIINIYISINRLFDVLITATRLTAIVIMIEKARDSKIIVIIYEDCCIESVSDQNSKSKKRCSISLPGEVDLTTGVKVEVIVGFSLIILANNNAKSNINITKQEII